MERIPIPEQSDPRLHRSSDSIENEETSVIDDSRHRLNESSCNQKILLTFIFMMLLIVIGSIHYYFMRYGSKESENSISLHKDDENNQPFSQKDDQPAIFSHDEKCYTQGLFFINQTHLFETCGLTYKSYYRIMRYDPHGIPSTIQEIHRSKVYDNSLFFEGSTQFPPNNLIYILTWKNHKVLRLNITSSGIKQTNSLNWARQGWGLTHNNTHIIISDGSNKLYVTDENLNILEQISVIDQNHDPIKYLNELQYVEQEGKGYVYANVYLTDTIVKISLVDGMVSKKYSQAIIAKKETQKRYDEVLNGIAYHPQTKQFLLTGKNWKGFYLLKEL